MIFQDPFSAMNPGMRVEDVIAEPLRIHRVAKATEMRDRVAELLTQVGLPPDSGSGTRTNSAEGRGSGSP